jgi:DDE superfamily endonuclease
MRALPPKMVQVLASFAPLFSKRVFRHAQVLLIGAILAPGARTVSSALRAMGLDRERQFHRYHRVLSRASWSRLEAGRVLLGLLVKAFVPEGDPLVVGIDETLERRYGKKISARGVYRDPVRSTHENWDMSIYDENKEIEGDENVLIAGKFSGPTSTQKNLLLVDGNTGKVIRWYNSPSLKSALAAPDVGRVYGGGVSLTAFELSGKKLWSRAKTTVDTSLYPTNAPSPSYRDLELDPDGETIWAACACDAVDGTAAKALVKLDAEGNHDASWRAAADPPSWGMSVVEANGALYLGAGGSDYLAEFSKANGGDPTWVRDTSGSVQVVEEMDGQLVIGGHFWEIADQLGDNCGHRAGAHRSSTLMTSARPGRA